MMQVTEKSLKRTRLMYIFEALLEYLISMLVAGTYLARLTDSLGFSDSLTGIITSFIALGCLFQMLSMLFRRKTVKWFVVGLSIANQLLFMFLYLVPIVPLSKNAKTALFLVFLLLAYLLYYIAHPKKINWFMSAVNDSQRGRFTANKEIVSLAVGILFTMGMGRLVDTFEERGQQSVAFLLCGAVIFIIMVLHTLTMIFSVEPQLPEKEARKGFLKDMASLFRNQSVLRIAILFLMWNVASHVTTSFYGSYQLKELGFTQVISSTLVSVSSLTRMAVSRFWGRYADKHSFAKMIRWCFLSAIIAFAAAACAQPATGLVCFSLYYVFHGVAMGGINSALTNLVFDYVPPEKRADSLAFSQALSGVAGFLATLAVSPLVSLIQTRQQAGNGPTLFGLPIYAQQITSVLAVICTLGCVLYVSLVIMKKEKR